LLIDVAAAKLHIRKLGGSPIRAEYNSCPLPEVGLKWIDSLSAGEIIFSLTQFEEQRAKVHKAENEQNLQLKSPATHHVSSSSILA
jgi:hypothetical protein